MRYFLERAVLVAILSSFSLLSPVAQESSPSSNLVARTNLVVVPVVVTDKQGNPARGLTREDFELKENGTVQKIADFEEIAAESIAARHPAVAPNAFTNQVIAQHPKRLEIIALDLLNSSFTDRNQAQRGLIDFLSRSVDPTALLALVVFRADGVELIHNFTSDSSVLVAAIKKAQGPMSSRDMSTAGTGINGHQATEEDTEAAELQSIFAGRSGDSGSLVAALATARAQAKGAQALVDASRQSQEGLITLECLQQVAQFFSSVPGRKSLIWASTGFSFSMGSMTGELTGGATPEVWQSTMRKLQDADIAVYPVDVGGLVASAQGGIVPNNTGPPLTGTAENIASRSASLEASAAGRLSDPIQLKHETMGTLADMTGGEAFYNRNDIQDLFRRAAQDSAEYYMLTYYTKDTGKYGWRKLNVHVRREGVHVRYRAGFFFNKASHNPDVARQLDETMALTSALDFTSLPINGTWQQIETAGDKRKVHFLLSIPPSGADVDTERGNQINLDFLVVARNSNGQDAARVSQQVNTKLSAAAITQIQAHGISYANALTLMPGEYSIHLVVRDNLTGRIGSVVTPLNVN